MTFLVAYDGSPLARAALARAVEFAAPIEASVVVVTAIPKRNATYAREHGWLAADEPFDVDAVVETVASEVARLAPEAAFEHVEVGRRASPGTVAAEVRRAAERVEADVLFVGSRAAGTMNPPVSSTGATVASDDDYDVVIVRTERTATDDLEGDGRSRGE
jgi:nucleotide-binding universal stress UspA family protein